MLQPRFSAGHSESYRDKPLLAVKYIMKIHSELFFLNGIGLSQPTAEGSHLGVALFMKLKAGETYVKIITNF